MPDYPTPLMTLRRIFSGPSAPIAQIARIEALANEIQTEAKRVARFSR
jgi:hypothetical protein